MGGGVLFVEELGVHAIGITLESDGTAEQMREEHIGDARVVINDLRLREAARGVEHFAQIGDADFAPPDVEFRDGWQGVSP